VRHARTRRHLLQLGLEEVDVLAGTDSLGFHLVDGPTFPRNSWICGPTAAPAGRAYGNDPAVHEGVRLVEGDVAPALPVPSRGELTVDAEGASGERCAHCGEVMPEAWRLMTWCLECQADGHGIKAAT
jgi:hypothetical protein